MQKLFILLFLFTAFYAGDSIADLYPGGPQDPRDIIDTMGGVLSPVELEVENTTYFRICEIRRYFCGGTRNVMIAAAIFIIGALVLQGKITWGAAITVFVGVAIFSTAEYVTEILTSFPPTLGVIYSCYCQPTQILGFTL